jgi:hypothetical protein
VDDGTMVIPNLALTNFLKIPFKNEFDMTYEINFHSSVGLQIIDNQIKKHSYDILGAGMLWKPKETRILKNFINQRVNIR